MASEEALADQEVDLAAEAVSVTDAVQVLAEDLGAVPVEAQVEALASVIGALQSHHQLEPLDHLELATGMSLTIMIAGITVARNPVRVLDTVEPADIAVPQINLAKMPDAHKTPSCTCT